MRVMGAASVTSSQRVVRGDKEHRRLKPLMNPRSIAIVGASDRGNAATAIRLLREWGYPGGVFPVNPRRTEVMGLPCYPTLEATPELADLALVVVRRDTVMEVLRDAHRVGVRAAIVIAADFAGIPDPVGRATQDEMTQFAADTGLLVCGPNCLGLINVRAKATPFGAPLDLPVIAGNLAIVAQSGGNAVAFATSAYERHLGISYLVSSGNEACLQLPDYINYLVADPDTRVICAYVEGIREPARFHAAALAAHNAGKPFIAIKVGRSERGRAVALAHTGALSSPDDLVDALFADAGVLRADSIDDALDKCSLFAQLEPDLWPRGRNLALVTNGGGAAAIFVDQASSAGMEFPSLPPAVRKRLEAVFPPNVTIHNPVEVPGGQLEEAPTLFGGFIDECARVPDYDAVAVGMLPVARLLSAVAPAETTQIATSKPVIIFTPSGVSAPASVHDFRSQCALPVILGIDRFVTAYRAAVNHRELKPRPFLMPDGAPSPRAFDVLRDARVEAGGSGAQLLDPQATWRILEEYGLPVTRQGKATSADEAAKLAARIGYPVALKIDSPGHKTEMGGVILDLRDAAGLGAAFERLASRREEATGPARRGAIVQAMASPGIEMYLGISNAQPGYPPAILVGFGGTIVELVKDVVLRFAPLTAEDALDMVKTLRAHALLEGFRGAPRADIRQLVEVIRTLSRMAIDLHSHIAQLDINPLILSEDGKGGRIVDARVVLRTE